MVGSRKFTLLELLLTMGIIVLLAGLLLPVLSHSRDESKAADCRNNLRQIALANLSYSTDFDHYCPYIGGTAMAVNIPTWLGRRGMTGVSINRGGYLDDYLSASRNIMICPSWNATGTVEATNGTGYGYNWKGIGSMSYCGNDAYGIGMKLALIQKFVDTVMFTDAANGGGMEPVTEPIGTLVIFPRFYPHGIDDGTIQMKSGFGYNQARHQHRVAAAWADGHVDMTEITQTAAYPTARRHRIGWIGPSDDYFYRPFRYYP